MTIQRQITLDQYWGIKYRNRPRPYHRRNYDHSLMQHGERSANPMLYFEVDLEKGKKG
jgi:hypothetical protein